MADEDQLRVLKQGVAVWNDWRRKGGNISIDLSNATLIGADLINANLFGANLSGANLGDALLTEATLSEVNLSDSDLDRVDLNWANLSGSNLSDATLSWASLSGSNLSGAVLSGANLFSANLTGANVLDTNFSEAILIETVLADLDLSKCKGLESCSHDGPSIIDIRTLQLSGRLPLAFLRGVGLSDALIDGLPSLLGQPNQFHSCFISYSSKDEAFVRRLHADLQDNKVRCWFAPEDMKIGAKIRDTIDDAFRLRDKVLIVLSEAAIASDWVEDEVDKAFEEERQRGGVVLFPVRLDNAVMETNEAWAAKLRRSRNIGDFRTWKEHDAYQKAFERVMRDLRVETT